MTDEEFDKLWSRIAESNFYQMLRDLRAKEIKNKNYKKPKGD